MITRRMRSFWVPILAAALLLASGCSSPDPEIELPSASALEASLTPLSEATGGAFGGLDAGSLADADLDGQRAIQLCMKQQGFEYVATVPIDDLPLEQVVFYGSLPETAAIAEEGGFGLAAQFDRAVSAMTVEEIIAADPNTVITGTLSEAELAAYELALWGDEPPQKASRSFQMWAVSVKGFCKPNGCSNSRKTLLRRSKNCVWLLLLIRS